MANEPDSDADNWESIEVRDTTERDTPEFGAVTLRIVMNKLNSQTIRMTREDAGTLADKLSEYLYNYETSN